MEYSIIFTVDCGPEDNLTSYYPDKSIMCLLTKTEGNEEAEYIYDGLNLIKHRKWIGILNQEQFERFVSTADLFAEDVETMGSIGAMGCGIGVVPAVAFNGDSSQAITGAYVTPMPESEEEAAARTWEEVREALIKEFG